MSIYEKYKQLNDPNFVENYDFRSCFTVGDPEGVIFDLDVAVALLRTDGHISAAAKLLLRSRRVLDTYIQRNLMLQEMVDDLYEAFLDDSEQKTKDLARAGDPATLRYVLGTRGKSRGYVTRAEVTGADGEALGVQFFLPVNNRDQEPEAVEDAGS